MPRLKWALSYSGIEFWVIKHGASSPYCHYLYTGSSSSKGTEDGRSQGGSGEEEVMPAKCLALEASKVH